MHFFELACANDSTGNEDKAAPLYTKALNTGLTGIRRRRAIIQLSSTLRNLGQAEKSVRLLEAESKEPSDELDDAVLAFLSLALVDIGKPKEATAIALGIVSKYLPRYNRSLNGYASKLLNSAKLSEN
jgi:hypothetical protein